MSDRAADEMVEKGIVHRRFCWTCHAFRDRHESGTWHAPSKCVTPQQCIELASKNPPIDGIVADFR